MTEINTPELTVKEGDTRPTLEYELDDAINLLVADEVRLYVQHHQSGDLIVNSEVDVSSDQTVSYRFEEHETTRVGRHLAEFVVYNNGDTQTIPSDTFLAIDVHRALDRDLDPEEIDDQDISVSVLSVESIRSNGDGPITLRDTLDADGNPITSLPEPDVDSDAATKGYVDTEIENIEFEDDEVEDHDHQGDFLLPETLKTTGDEELTVSVPTDYDTLTEAIADVAKYQLPADVGVEITLESGHEIQENVLIENANLGHVTITSEDAEVGVDAEFTGHIFEGHYSTLPVLDCTINMGGNGENGYYLRTCRLYATEDNGILNAGHRGVEVRDTVFNLSGTDFSGADNRCYNITRASMGSVTWGTGNDAGEHGLFVSRSARVNAIEGTFNNNGSDGVKVQRAWCALESAEATGNTESGLWCLGASVIDARFADFSGNGSRAIRATDGANNITADYADLSNPGHACIDASNESTVSATETELQDSEWPATVRTRTGATVTINESDVTGHTEDVVRCEGGGIVRTHDVTDDGAALDATDTNIGEFNSVSSDGIIFN